MDTRVKLPPPWLRVRDAAERERERKHLALMQRREREALRAGINCRPRPAETVSEVQK